MRLAPLHSVQLLKSEKLVCQPVTGPLRDSSYSHISLPLQPRQCTVSVMASEKREYDKRWNTIWEGGLQKGQVSVSGTTDQLQNHSNPDSRRCSDQRVACWVIPNSEDTNYRQMSMAAEI